MPGYLYTEADWQQYEKDRLEVLTSLDVEKFRAFLTKHDEPPKPGTSDITLLAGMHYARLNFNLMSLEAKRVSEQWLREHGYNPYPTFK